MFFDNKESDCLYLNSQTKTNMKKEVSNIEIIEFALTTSKKRKTLLIFNCSFTLYNIFASSFRRFSSYKLDVSQTNYILLFKLAIDVMFNLTTFHSFHNHLLSASEELILYRKIRTFRHYYNFACRYVSIDIVRLSSILNISFLTFAQTTNAQENTIVLFRHI